jgi:hypothetical protein
MPANEKDKISRLVAGMARSYGITRLKKLGFFIG